MDLSEARSREWLVTNGLGGYAMGTVAGIPTRGYHAPLVSAGPGGRTVLVQHLLEVARADGDQVALTGMETAEGTRSPDVDRLASFAIEEGLPTWRYRVSLGVLEKRVAMVQGATSTQVVTPRRGKAVEVNALWYAALRQVALWTGDAALHAQADRVSQSFNARFWSPAHGHLFDVVDGEAGDDPALRPNQLWAISLPHPVLARDRWRSVLAAVRRALWTPLGLRTLDPSDPRYRGLHAGDVAARDAAYHNGTAWPFLLGAWVDAELAVDPSASWRIRGELSEILATLAQGAVGTLAEIFSGSPPHAPEGAPAQAWSVAELLRALARLG